MDSPLKWPGGKHYLADKIISLMPKHIHYVEPYFGGGSVLFAKNPEGVSEVANDINGELTNFWDTLKDPESFKQFQLLCNLTPFSEVEWNRAKTSGERTLRFFIRCRQSMAGRMKSFAPLSKTRVRRGMNEQVSAWLSCIDGLSEVHERLQRVVILNHSATYVIQKQDGPGTLFYLDPPYLHETRKSTDDYEFEMSERQHKQLLDILKSIRGKFMLSGYRSSLYDSYGWNRHEFELPNNAASGESKQRMIECVWCNF